ncbi:MAG: alpha/beta fold hydrolase [Betaproteobacteria bacterium]
MPQITINGFRCNYRYEPIDGAPCVIFLNGIMSSLESWQPQVEQARRLGFGTLQYEYRGQWRSEMTPGPYTMQTHVDDLRALMAALGIERAHLVGTSYGGMTGMLFASRHAQSAASLMLIATTALIRPLPRCIVSNWCIPAARNDVDGLFKAMLPELYSEAFMEQHRNLLTERLTGLTEALAEIPDFCAGQLLLNEAQFPDISDGRLLDAISRIACPTLVVAAEEDRLYPPSDSRAIAARIPKAEYLIVAGAGHAVLAERPEAVNIALAGHLVAGIAAD